MPLDMLRLLRDHNVEHATEGSTHCQAGWVQVHCPFCQGKRNYHLGYNLRQEYWNCWRCGWHSIEDVISELLNVGFNSARDVMKEYSTRYAIYEALNKEPVERPAVLQWPFGAGPLQQMHKQYLAKRKFDPDWLERTYRIMGTGHLGEYKFRIIVPVFFAGMPVSYHGRDITGKSTLSYKACEKSHEIRDHKDCLYAQELIPGDSVVIVEGYPDAWRMGPGAVATFGVKFTLAQVELLRKYKRRFILYDSEAKDPNAPEQARKLAFALSIYEGETEILDLDDGDPGDMKQEDADYIMRDLGFK